MRTPSFAYQEQYVLGRKMALVLGFAMLAFFGMMQSAVFSRNLGASGPVRVHKEIPFTKFHLEHNESWSLSIAGRPLGDGDSVVFKPSALEKRETYEVKDNLKWHEGKPVAEKRPEALEWYRFSSIAANPSVKKKQRTARKRLLVAQFSNHGEFAEIFKLTKRVNIAYAERWQHDIVFLNAQDLPVREANLATLVQLAWEQRDNYDQLLLMDADAMMNNFRSDITLFLPGIEMMVAKRIEGGDDVHTWKIFDTVSIWNLRHLLTPRVQKTWSNRFEEEDPLINLGEQLKPYAETEVFTVTGEIGEFDSSLIKTMQFATKTHGLRSIDPKVRIQRWSKEVSRACKRWRIDCSEFASEQRRVSLIPEPGCEERREPSWEWHEQRSGKPKTQKRLLIAQFVSHGEYAKLMETTSPINKLYAQKWNVDYVSVKGTTLTVDQDGDCEPPPQRAMFDKLALLRMALHKKDKYDQLLILDAEAMIYDLNFDVTTLLQDDDLLVAQRGEENDLRTHTWNINNGIVLWDLNHAIAPQVAEEWYKTSRSAVESGDSHGDQHYLQAVLREGNRQQFVRSLEQEFGYRRGTVIKDFIRQQANNEWDKTRVDAREAEITSVIKEICEKFPSECQTMERSVYLR